MVFALLLLRFAHPLSAADDMSFVYVSGGTTTVLCYRFDPLAPAIMADRRLGAPTSIVVTGSIQHMALLNHAGTRLYAPCLGAERLRTAR